MSQTKQITVSDITYNCAMASAMQQDEILSILSSTLMQRAFVAAKNGIPFDEKSLMPLVMSLPYDAKSRVASALLEKVYVNGTTLPVSIKDFAGKMVDYNTLLSRLVEFNFADFFTWLQSVVESDQLTTGKNPS